MILTRFIAYVRVDDRRIFCQEYVVSKPQNVIPLVCQIKDEVDVVSLCSIQVGVIQTSTIFEIHLMDQVHELLISDVFQRDQIMGI